MPSSGFILNNVYKVFVKGAPDLLIKICRYVEENGEIKPLNKEIEQKILVDINSVLLLDTLNQDISLNIATTMISDQGIQQLYTQLVQADAQLKGILKEYSTKHPKYAEIKAKYDGFKEQLKDE